MVTSSAIQVYILAQQVYEAGFAAHEDFHAANMCKSLRSGTSNRSSYIWVDFADASRHSVTTMYKRGKNILEKLFDLYLTKLVLGEHLQEVMASLRDCIAKFTSSYFDPQISVSDKAADLQIDSLRKVINLWIARYTENIDLDKETTSDSYDSDSESECVSDGPDTHGEPSEQSFNLDTGMSIGAGTLLWVSESEEDEFLFTVS